MGPVRALCLLFFLCLSQDFRSNGRIFQVFGGDRMNHIILPSSWDGTEIITDIPWLSHGKCTITVQYLKSFNYFIMPLRFLRWPLYHLLTWGDWEIVQCLMMISTSSEGDNKIWWGLTVICPPSLQEEVRCFNPMAIGLFVTAASLRYENCAVRRHKQTYAPSFEIRYLQGCLNICHTIALQFLTFRWVWDCCCLLVDQLIFFIPVWIIVVFNDCMVKVSLLIIENSLLASLLCLYLLTLNQ